MALAVTSGLTEWDDCDTSNWTGDPTVGVDTDFKREGTGCIGIDVDIETHHMFGAAKTAVDLSSNYLYCWLLSFSASTLDTKALGGMQIAVEDGSGNQSYWYVGGSDTYTGGWEVFSCSTAATPDGNNGTNATLTNIVKVGVGFKNTAKSKLTQNCFVDWVRYGTGPALTVTGTNTTVGDGWSEAQTLDSTGAHGIIKAIPGGYLLKGPIQIGDSAGTGTTDFTDVGASLVFDNLPVGDAQYKVSVAGNATGTTYVELGSVVGTGDDRQGVNGNSIKSIGPAWEWDSATDIADLDSVHLYGCSFRNAHAGIGLDDNTKTSAISTQFLNCGEINPGTTNDGAELLSCFVIDPEGTANNYGLLFPQTPAVGILTHNCKKMNFITSGTPATQYMVRFTDASDYSVTFDEFSFFGVYTSGTIQHGRNEGLNADVTIEVVTAGNVDDTDFTNTASGTVTANNAVPVTVTVLDDDTGLPIATTARVYIELVVGGTEILNSAVNASGVATANYNYSGDVDIVGWVREMSLTGTDYHPRDIGGTIESSGFSLTVRLKPLS